MLEKLKTIIEEYTSKTDLEITEKTVLIADLGLNSLDLINLACVVEEEFDVEIPDRALRNIKTVGDVLDLLDN